MGKYFEHSIVENCKTNREILEKVYERALAERQPAKVSYRPCTIQPYIDMVNRPGVDFAAYYPDYQPDDFAYMNCCVDGLFEKDMLINVKSGGKVELYFNGERQELIPAPGGTTDAKVTFQKGKNTILLKVTAVENHFEAYVYPLVPGLRMGASDYVYCTWQYIEKEGFRLQSGLELSRLYRRGEETPMPDRGLVDWVYPVLPPQNNRKYFDFLDRCQKGQAAYAYTWAKGNIQILHKSPLKIFCSGQEIYSASEGQFVKAFDEETELLIKSCRGEDGWGFEATTEGTHSLPFVDGADCPDLHWLWIGPFGRADDALDEPYAPEGNLQFEEPYASVCGGQVYWHFYRKDTDLKQYLHSNFYGQWFYALMVGHYGMKQAAKKLGKKDFSRYFMESMKLLCRHRNYAVLDGKLTGWATYLPRCVEVDRLDPVGTIGINIAEYYMMSGDEKAQYLLEVLANALTYKVPRFEDGTFHRVTTMWTDDTYMCLPFLARLGVMTGEERYFDDILTQVRGFYQRMYMEDQNLFSHIYFVKEEKANRIPWGRGNGWVLLALSEVLLLLPKEYHGRDEILKLFCRFAQGILKYRDKEKGFWHQVLNNPDSYMEASGSAMFITALARGVIHGWIDKQIEPEIEEAWIALAAECIDAEGNVYGVCKGSGCSMEEQYYLNLGTIVNDDHGVGIVLGACVEIMNMVKFAGSQTA